MRSLVPFLLLFISWATQPIRAQYRINHFTTKDGLTQGSVYYMLEDSRGYIWMSSQNGLNRLEGSHFRTFQHQDGDPATIGKGEVRGIVEAPSGDLWVGTELCLSRYIRRTGTFQNYYLHDKRGHRQFAQCQPFWADDSTIWFLNDRQGVARFNYRQNQLTVVLPDIDFQYTTITRLVWMDAQHQCIWLRLPEGILRYQTDTGQRTYFFTNRPDNRLGKPSTVYAVGGIGDGSAIWLSTSRGLVRLNENGFRTYSLGVDPDNDITYALTFDRVGNLWASSSRSGLFVLDTTTGRIIEQLQHQALQPQSLISNYISELYTDRQGLIWATADPKGVELIYPTALKPTAYEDDPLDSTDFNGAAVRGIVIDQTGELWVGTVGEGIRRVDPKTGRISRPLDVDVLRGASVRALWYTPRGQLLIGTKLGVSIYDEQTTQLTTLPIQASVDKHLANAVRGICQLAQDRYVVATQKGLYILNSQNRTYTTLDSLSSYSGALYYDSTIHQLFAGRRERDLQCFLVKKTSLQHQYDALPGFSPLCFRAASLSGKTNILWVGTDNGLILFDVLHRKVIRHYTQRDGLPNPVVYSVLADTQDNLWISSDNGLAIFDQNHRFHSLPESMGIEFNSYAALQFDPQTMYLGSVAGLHLIRPEALGQSRVRAIRFTDLRINDQPARFPLAIDEMDTLRLSFNQRNITISVAALNYIVTQPPLYRYRLQSQHDNWVISSSNAPIRYTNLPAHTYQLQVQVLDSNGQWVSARPLLIIITPPFWQRLWFICLICIALISSFYGLVQIYVHRKQIKQKQLMHRLIQVQEEERLRIAQDLHDDVGNTLAAAKGLLEKSTLANSILDNKIVSQSKDLLTQAVIELRTVTHNLMPIDFTQVSLSEVIEKQATTISQSSPVYVNFIQAGTIVKLAPETELTIYRIVCELLQNIRKHARATQAVLQLIYQSTELVVSVEDNGIGLAKAQKKEATSVGIGLRNVSSRAEYIHGTLTFQSDDSGVLILLQIPYESNTNDHSRSHR